MFLRDYCIKHVFFKEKSVEENGEGRKVFRRKQDKNVIFCVHSKILPKFMNRILCWFFGIPLPFWRFKYEMLAFIPLNEGKISVVERRIDGFYGLLVQNCFHCVGVYWNFCTTINPFKLYYVYFMETKSLHFYIFFVAVYISLWAFGMHRYNATATYVKVSITFFKLKYLHSFLSIRIHFGNSFY